MNMYLIKLAMVRNDFLKLMDDISDSVVEKMKEQKKRKTEKEKNLRKGSKN